MLWRGYASWYLKEPFDEGVSDGRWLAEGFKNLQSFGYRFLRHRLWNSLVQLEGEETQKDSYA